MQDVFWNGFADELEKLGAFAPWKADAAALNRLLRDAEVRQAVGRVSPGRVIVPARHPTLVREQESADQARNVLRGYRRRGAPDSDLQDVAYLARSGPAVRPTNSQVKLQRLIDQAGEGHPEGRAGWRSLQAALREVGEL